MLPTEYQTRQAAERALAEAVSAKRADRGYVAGPYGQGHYRVHVEKGALSRCL